MPSWHFLSKILIQVICWHIAVCFGKEIDIIHSKYLHAHSRLRTCSIRVRFLEDPNFDGRWICDPKDGTNVHSYTCRLLWRLLGRQ
jgi:hypothetical protein